MTWDDFFHYAFIWRALLAGILIAALSALLGVFLILRRLSLIGDGLAHVTFGSVAIVILVGINPSYLTLAVLPLVMLSSLAILKFTQSRRIHGDAAIGIVSSAGIAIALLAISLSQGYNLNLFSYLFGNILTVTEEELWLSEITFLVVVSTVVIFHRKLLALSFDEDLAQTMGIKTKKLNTALLLLTAVTTVLAIKIAGIMLASAMFILPPITAIQLARGFKKTLWTAVATASISVIGGLALALGLNLPPGGSIILFNIGLLLTALGKKKLLSFFR